MKKLLFANLLLLFFTAGLFAQCENWTKNPAKDDIENEHVLYRGFMKEKNFDEAFPHWEKVYKAAPAADGKRSFHYSDGIDLYIDKFGKETDATKKKEYVDIILKLYEQWAECYPKESADLRSNQVYNMFYVLNTPYAKTVEIIQKAIDISGEKTSYSIIDPYPRIPVHQLNEKKIDAATARDRHEILMKIADFGAKNSKEYSDYYKTSKEAIISIFAPIERQIFDCEYFKNKYLDMYRADPDNKDVYREVYKQLKMGGCGKDDPIVYEIYLKDSLATMAEFKANNPGFLANELYKAGDYSGAIAKYNEALNAETDASKKAGYYFSIASIQFRKLKKYSDARRSALKAAELRPGWGQPYLMIGDMYASSSNSCGKDAFEKGLAVLAALDKYAKAKSIDSDPAIKSEAQSKINKYAAYKPDQSDGFMMGVKAGDVKKVPCWIGETVTVRFK